MERFSRWRCGGRKRFSSLGALVVSQFYFQIIIRYLIFKYFHLIIAHVCLRRSHTSKFELESLHLTCQNLISHSVPTFSQLQQLTDALTDISLNMSSKLLTDLPPELLIQILKSSDNFSDVTSLSSTSRKLFIIWKTNTDAICETILPRNVPCFAQACGLKDAQEKHQGDLRSVFSYQSTSDRVRWLMNGAAIAAQALRYFEKTLVRLYRKNRPLAENGLTLEEQTDFIRSFYRAVTLAILFEDSLPGELMLSWSHLDFEQVRDVIHWIARYAPHGLIENLGLSIGYQKSARTLTSTAHFDIWKKLKCLMLYLGKDLYSLIKVDTATQPRLRYSEYPWILHNRCQDTRKVSNTTRLEELFILLQRRGSLYNTAYKLSGVQV